jgi:nicotinamidase-related amidase
MSEDARTETTSLAQQGLVDSQETILLLIDIQDEFLKKLPHEQAEALLDNVRFLSEVGIRLEIPILVTVEEAASNGSLHPSLKAVLGPDVSERDKVYFGLCGQEDLRSALLEQNRRTVVLVGLETDVCVLQSAIGLQQLGFRTLIVVDAVASPSPDHEYGLDRARAFGVELIHTKGLYYEFARSLRGLEHLKKAPPIRPPARSKL